MAEARDRLTLAEACGLAEGLGRTPLSELIDGWCGHVLRFLKELQEHWENRSDDVWGIDDLAGTYYLRDRIDALLAQHGGLPPHALELADEVLRSFTIETDFNWSTHTGQTAGAGWWWRRIPTHGPVSEQVLGWGD